MTKPSQRDPWKTLLLAWAILMTVLFAATQIEPRRPADVARFEFAQPAAEAGFVALPDTAAEDVTAVSPYPAYEPAASPASSYGCAENGSCYGDMSYDTGRPKTVHVEGYVRSDGTYVRGHYRSAPR